jgi:hypothetical protein
MVPNGRPLCAARAPACARPASAQVYGLPTLMVFKDGELVEDSHREGAFTKAILKKYIEDHILATVNA